MIVWREKFIATAIHFLVTLALAACAAALIFLVWFPDPFADHDRRHRAVHAGRRAATSRSARCISLVIYNSRKSRRKLIIDYAIVGTVQIAALVYGVFIVAGTRPAYVAFSADRLEVVTARDIHGCRARGGAQCGVRDAAVHRTAPGRHPGAPGGTQRRHFRRRCQATKSLAAEVLRPLRIEARQHPRACQAHRRTHRRKSRPASC